MSRVRNTRMSATVVSATTEEDIEGDDRLVRAARRRAKRKARSERAEWWSTKLHALLWVIGAIVAFFATDFVNVCLAEPISSSYMFKFGIFLFILEFLAILRMAFWFPSTVHTSLENANIETADFEKAHPTFVLITTLGGVLCFIVLTISIWPVFRIFSPFLLILFWFGLVMSLHFFP